MKRRGFYVTIACRGELKKMKKTSSKNNGFYRVVIIALVLIIAFSLYKVGTILYEYYVGTKEYNQLQELAGTKELAEGVRSLTVDFDALREKNEDVEAWIYSKDTVINYPVVQGNDNQYYLYRMLNGEWNGKGTLFIDYRVDKPFRDFNTIIYGHRMKDGSMFHSIVDYRDKNYFEKHRKMQLMTPKKNYDLVIFGVVTIPADSDKYKMEFYGEDDKQAYLDWIEENSEIDTGVKATTKDKLVMLSTCTYEFDDARLVVYGKLAEREDEK